MARPSVAGLTRLRRSDTSLCGPNDRDAAMSDPNLSDTESGWTPRAQRNLKIAVIVMGVLLVVGFFVVFATIALRIAGSDEPAQDAAPATVLNGDVARLLGPKAEVVSTSVDGGRLAVVVQRPEGISILVVDLRSGALVNVIGAE